MFLHDIIEDLDLKTLLALSAGKDRNYTKLKEDAWHGEGDAWHGTGNEPRDAWHGTDGAVEEAQTKERNYNNGDRVKLTSEYADHRNPNEVFTVSQCDQERRRCWIGDKQGRGWYAEFEQIMPARSRSVEEGLEDSGIQDAIVDTVKRLFRKQSMDDYGALDAVCQGVKHHFSKPGATAESAIEGILNILDRRRRKSGAHYDLSKFKDALRQGLAHHLHKQGVEEGYHNNIMHAWNSGMDDDEIVKRFGQSAYDSLKRKYGSALIPVPDLYGYKSTEPTDPLTRSHRGLDGLGKRLKSQIAQIKDKGVTEAEGDADGLPHLTKELLQHIIQQVGLEGAHAIVKSLEWGDGAAEELLALILKDLKANISDEEIAEHIGQVKDGYRLYSHKGKNLGTFDTKAGAEKHEREVQYFKHASESLDEDFSDSPVAGAITRRILSQRLDLLKQYGPELVGAAVDNVADFVGEVEEIGTSDVSAWVNQVERMLEENPPDAFAEGDAYVSATRKGNGVMAAHYLKQHLKHKADAAKTKQGVAEGAALPLNVIELIKKIAQSSATPEHKKAMIDALVAKHSKQGVEEGEQSHGDKLRATPTERLMAFWNKYKDEPGISPVFGQQIKAIANELARRKQKMELLSLHRDNYINRNNDINEATSNEAVTNAIINRIIGSHVSLLGKYGPEAVTSAAEDVAYHVGEVEEIGSSDVSAWVREVFNQLRDNHG